MVVWVGEIEKCDICKDAFTDDTMIDGRTKMGPRANMCKGCHKEYGVGLGVGYGQKYKKRGGKWVKVSS